MDVVYDSVGRDTFDGSLESLALRGHLVNFGQASGSVPPFEVSRLAARSTSVSRPILFHYIVERDALERLATPVFAAVLTGLFPVEPGRAFPLTDAAAAHRALEGRQADGPLVLMS